MGLFKYRVSEYGPLPDLPPPSPLESESELFAYSLPSPTFDRAIFEQQSTINAALGYLNTYISAKLNWGWNYLKTSPWP